MNFTKKLIATCFLGLATVFTGCITDGDDDEVSVTNFALSATSADVGSTVYINGSVKSDANVTGMTVTISLDGADATSDFTITKDAPPSETSFDLGKDEDVSISITPKSSAESGDYSVSLTVNAGGTSTTKSATLTVTGGSSGTDFARSLTGAFFHIAGACRGSYDLEGNTSVSNGAGNSISDMVNSDAAGAAFTGSWTTGTGNNTTYVKDNSYDYDNATVESATAAHSAGSASGTVNNPANNDIYIAGLSAGGYAVIKVTNVNPGTAQCDEGGATNNTGKITFSYKIN